MQEIVLFDDEQRKAFLPLAFTRALGDFHIGHYTLSDRWSKVFDLPSTALSLPYLNTFEESDKQALFINARVIPSRSLLTEMKNLSTGSSLTDDNSLVAFKGASTTFLTAYDRTSGTLNTSEWVAKSVSAKWLESLTDIFNRCGELIQWDFDEINTSSAALPDWATIIGDRNQVYVHPSATVLPCTINVTNGPVIIGENAVVMEHCALRGPLVIGEGTQIKMGAKIYGPTSFGPQCRVGGEVSNSVILGYSNKGHDGFVGNSVIGEWCNLGADTNTSNLKNNYSLVKRWSYASQSLQTTYETFCGLIMGDHSKCGINTMFNTATTVGVGCNVYGGSFPKKFVPDFTWGDHENREEYDFAKCLDTAKAVMSRRNRQLDQAEVSKLRHIFDLTAPYRT